MKIGIIGNYGATNVGDDAILRQLLKELKGHKVTVFSAYVDQRKKQENLETAPLFPLGLRSVLKFGFNPSKVAMKEVDVVIFGGGGLFQDDRLYAVFLWAWQLFWVRWYRKPYFIYATGVGPLRTKIGRWLTKKAYQKADLITVRDEQSAKLLKEIGVKKEIIVTADPVFLSSPQKEEGKTHAYQPGLVIISLRPWLFYNLKIIDTFAEFLKGLKKERKVKLVFVSMQELREDDKEILTPLLKQVNGELFIPKDFETLLDLLKTAEFGIGMRYHFMIAALLAHVPLLPLSYSPKTFSLFEGTPMQSQVLKIEDLSAQKLKKAFKELSIGYNNRIIYEKAIAKNLQEKANLAHQKLAEFLKTFDHQPSK